MSQITLRLPDTLHHQLNAEAEKEGVSLDQYIAYVLTRQITQTALLQDSADERITQQKEWFAKLLSHLGKAKQTDIDAVLAKREVMPPEADLSSEAVSRLRQQIRDAQ